MSSAKQTVGNKKTSNEYLSSSTLEVIIDNESIDEDSNSQTKHPNSVATDDEQIIYRPRRQIKFTNKKSHRLIEKRRRDRMNRSLNVLLDLIPHKKPENERRIEKTEIIEMAIKYIRNLTFSNQKSCEPIKLDKKLTLKIDAYRCGYHNSLCDTYEYVEKHSKHDQFLTDLTRYIKRKENELKHLTVIPDEKSQIFLSKKTPPASCDISKPDIQTSEDHENIFQFSIADQQNSLEKIKVPIFVLHPSGTHYIPMCIDSSLVSYAFNNKLNLSQSSSINEQLRCHPVSIPVNFNPISAISDPYGLDIQNINVIGTRHQTSVKPN